MSGTETDEIIIHPLTTDPTRLWTEVYSKERVCRVIDPLISFDEPIRSDALRFVCISDTHNQLDQILTQIPPGDVLVHCGDFTNFGDIDEIVKFNNDLGLLPHKRKVVIAGNHDLGFDDEEDLTLRKPRNIGRGTPHGYELLTNCSYLSDSLIICGVKIYGASWLPLDGYSFSRSRGMPLLEKWLKIPPVDVLLTHTPPLGHNDVFRDNRNWGCAELLNCVEQRARPRFHVFGHVHERNGWTTNDVTHFINASICDHDNVPSARPHAFDVPLPAGHTKEELC